jgi:hypothetical protein
MDIYQELKEVLLPFDIQPVPFSTLKTGPRTKPLYKQMDFSPFMVVGVLLSLGLCAASVFYWFVYWTQSSKLDGDMNDIRSKIVDIQINKSLGDIREPEAMLADMKKAFEQKPSAIMQAGAVFGKEFGELDAVMFNTADTDMSKSNGGVRALTQGQHIIRILVSNVTNKLLVDQERLAGLILQKMPWIQRVENIPQGGGELTMDVVLQTENTGDIP